MTKIISFYGKSEKGRRPQNEDNFVIFKNNFNFLIAAVADGMGGHIGGRIASSYTIKILRDYFQEIDFTNRTTEDINEILVQGIKYISKNLIKISTENPDLMDMGTTLNLNIFINEFLYTVNIGDSRAGQYMHGHIHQITIDQNLSTLSQRDKTFKYKGIANMANLLTSSLGPRKETKLVITKTSLFEKGIIFISTDGLHNFVDDFILKNVLEKKVSLKEKTLELITESYNRGSNDNITLIMVEYAV